MSSCFTRNGGVSEVVRSETAERICGWSSQNRTVAGTLDAGV